MTIRYQTVAAGETWSVFGRFRTGRTVTVALFDGQSGAVIPLSSNATNEIAPTGVYRADSSQIVTDPVALTIIVWQMTDTVSGRTDEGFIAVGGSIDNIDAAISTRNSITPLAAATDQAEHDATQAAIAAQVVPMDAVTSLAEHDNTQAGIAANLAAIAALNDVSIADVQAALTAQGYTVARAPNLDNLDVAISTRNAVTPLAAATDQAEHDATQVAIAAQVVPMDAATSQAEHDATQAAIGGLNDLSIADVQTALDNQGYSAARALLLDNLDAAISSRNSVVPLDAATDLAEHNATQVGIGLNLAAIAALNDISVGDILGTILSSGNTVDAELSAVLALRDFIEGGRDIDFVGNDTLGWQRIERDIAGTLLRRYNLFDEAGARIDETVASFIARQGMISSEVAI